MTLLANPLKSHFLEYCQTNISLTGSQFSLSWVCLLYSPSSSHPRISHCLKNAIFCYHWWLTTHQRTEFQYPIPLMSKFPVLSISLFSAESGHNSYRKVPCFTNKVLEWYKHVFQIHNIPWWQDQYYSSANYIHCSAKLSVNFHNSPSKLFFLCPCKLSGWVSDIFVEGRHLSKIRLGANVTRKIYLSFVWCRVSFLSSSSISSSMFCCK